MKFKADYFTLQDIHVERNCGNDKDENKRDSLVTDVFYKDFSCQHDSHRNNVSCTCKRKKRHESGYFSTSRQVYRSIRCSGAPGLSDVGVGSIKTVPRKRVRRIYLLGTEDRGVGSSDLSSFIQRPKDGESYYDQKKTSSKCVGDTMEYNNTSVISKNLSPICNTKSGFNSATNANFEESKNVDNPLNDNIKIVEKSQKIDNTDANKTKKATLPKISKIKSVGVVLDNEKNDFSSDSLIQHVHNLENPSYIKESEISFDFTGNTLEKEYIKMFETKSKNSVKPVAEVKPIQDIKSASLRKRFEALRCGLSKKEVSKDPCVVINLSSQISTLRKDVSITSDPPSLEARSFINANIHSSIPPTLHKYEDVSQPSYVQPLTEENESSRWSTEVVDGDYQNAKGMFKLWGKKFKLDEDYHKESSIHAKPDTTQKPKKKVELVLPKEEIIEKEKKEGKRFLFFKKKNKDKSKQPYKPKNGITTGRCEVGDGLTVKIGAHIEHSLEASRNKYKQIPSRHDDNLRMAWLNKFLDKKNDSRKSVKIRWNNDMYTTSSSTVFELMECIYKNTGILFRSKSDMSSSALGSTTTEVPSYYRSHENPQVNYVQQTIQAWMMPEMIIDNKLKKIINIQNLKKKKNNDLEVTFSNQKWFIEKSKAFSQKIELVLKTNNILRDEQSDSSNYIVIDIPRGYFSESSSEDKGQTETSDEQVYNIVEYETVKSISHLENKRIDRKLDIGDHECNDIRVTINVKDKNVKESKLETVTKTPLHRDVVIQGSNVHIPKRCDVIGVGIITQHTPNRDIKDIKKPKLKMQDEITDDESTPAIVPQKKCELAETYLQDYYRNWTPLEQDLFTGCISDKNLRFSSDDNSLNSYQDDGSKSCPNINDDYYQTFSTVSSVEASYYNPYAGVRETKIGEFIENPITFFKKFQKKEDPCKPASADVRRVLPKDSLEVFKRRKIYAAIKLANQCWSSGVLQPSSVSSEGNECAQIKPTKGGGCCTRDPDAPKKVKMSKTLECEIVPKRSVDGIMVQNKPCNANTKQAKVNPEPTEIPPPKCLKSCIINKYPICSHKNSHHTPPSKTKSSPTTQMECKRTAPSPLCKPSSPPRTPPSETCIPRSPPCKPPSPPCKRPSPLCKPPSPPCKLPSPPCKPPSPPCKPPSPPCKRPSPLCKPPSPPCKLPSPPCKPPSPPCKPPLPPCKPPSPPCTPPSPTPSKCTPRHKKSSPTSSTDGSCSHCRQQTPTRQNLTQLCGCSRHKSCGSPQCASSYTSPCNTSSQSLKNEMSPASTTITDIFKRLVGKSDLCSPKSCGNIECKKKEKKGKEKAKNRQPKVSGLHLTMKPIPKNTSNVCQPNCNVIKLNSKENLFIRIKQGTPSTDEIRVHQNIKVQDEDGQTLYERHEYKANACDTKDNLLKDMYRNSRIHRVATSKTETALNVKKSESNQSNVSLSNIVEINFNIKFKQPDKTTEGNIKNDKLEDINNKLLKSTSQVNLKHVYALQDETKQSNTRIEDPEQKDVNIKIVINSYRQDTNKSKRKVNTLNLQAEDEFSRKISEKFHTVSTGYSDVLDIQTCSIQTTVNLSDSIVTSRQLMKPSEELLTEELTQKRLIYDESVVKHSNSSIAANNIEIQVQELELPRDICRNAAISATDNEEAISDVQECMVKISKTSNKEEKNKILKHIFDRSHDPNNIEKVFNQELPSEISRKSGISVTDNEETVSDSQESKVENSKTCNKEGEKEISKHIFDRSHDPNNIEKVNNQELPSDISRKSGLSATDNEEAISDAQECKVKISETRNKEGKKQISKHIFDLSHDPNNIEKVNNQELPSDISRKSGLSATDNEEAISDVQESKVKISKTRNKAGTKKILKYIFDHSHDPNNIEKVYGQELVSDISRNTDISETDNEGAISDVQESNVKIRKIRNKEEKKKILKQIFEGENVSQKVSKKSKMASIRKLLRAVLTSDSSEVEDVTDHDMAKELAYESLKPNYFKDTESMTNYYQFSSSISDNRLSNTTRNNSTDIIESRDNKNLRCPCNHMAKALNICSNNLTSCGCRVVCKNDKEVTCNLIDVLKIKKAEYIDAETQYWVSKDKLKKTVVQFQKVNCNDMETQNSDLNDMYKRSIVLITSNTDVINPRDDKVTDQHRNVFSTIPKMFSHSRCVPMKKLKNRQTLLGLSDDDKVIILNSESQELKTEAETVYRNGNLLKPIDILQLHETKKAVLEIYSEKVVFNQEERCVAKLPKFVYSKESQIVNYYKEMVNDIQQFSARNVLMMSITR